MEKKNTEKKNTPRKPSIIFYDIETSHLRADWGDVFCGSFAYSDSNKVDCLDITHFKGKDEIDDSRLVKAILEKLATGDMMVGWYSGGFDYKFLITKCVEYRMIPPSLPPHLDLWRTPYSDWLLTSNRLKNVREFLNLPDNKTDVWKRNWRLARAGNTKALQYVIAHCKQDAIVLKQAYYEMLPYIRNHPSLSLIVSGKCPVCGGMNLRKDGFRHNKSGSYQRYECNSCKHKCTDTHRSRSINIIPANY